MTTKDEATVAALDEEYQAAVARNDATTMDRILARGFVPGQRLRKGVHEGGSAGGSAKRSDCLRTPGRRPAHGSGLGRHGGRYCVAVGQRQGGRRAVRILVLVQRHVRPISGRMEIRLRPVRHPSLQGTLSFLPTDSLDGSISAGLTHHGVTPIPRALRPAGFRRDVRRPCRESQGAGQRRRRCAAQRSSTARRARSRSGSARG